LAFRNAIAALTPLRMLAVPQRRDQVGNLARLGLPAIGAEALADVGLLGRLAAPPAKVLYVSSQQVMHRASAETICDSGNSPSQRVQVSRSVVSVVWHIVRPLWLGVPLPYI
jgi:hypothetical protein